MGCSIATSDTPCPKCKGYTVYKVSRICVHCLRRKTALETAAKKDTYPRELPPAPAPATVRQKERRVMAGAVFEDVEVYYD